jgi:DNA-binding transcriptional ArsR family regulator
MRLVLSAVVGCVVAGCRAPELPHATVSFQKGQLHVHSNHSGDSETPPEEVARWYRDRGYDFIVFTDHNVVTSLANPPPNLLVIPGVELTQNLATCNPSPPGQPSGPCLLHLNALFVTPPDPPQLRWRPSSDQRHALYADAIAATKQLGGIAQLNHPNFHWGADAALIAELVRDDGLRLFEVANQSSDVANEGDATHASTEQLWDTVLASGLHLYGTATDDAHQYDGRGPDLGDRGWIMVRSSHDPDAIRAAIESGDFYATTGAMVHSVDRTGDALAIELDTPADITCIANGRPTAPIRARHASCAIPRGGYARATIKDANGKRAWIQPVWSPEVLGDPIRRHILESLADGERTSGELVEIVERKFTVSQSGVSQHLKVLRENGFATVRHEGTRRVYSLDTAALRDIDAWLERFRGFWAHRLDALATEVARGKRARRGER